VAGHAPASYRIVPGQPCIGWGRCPRVEGDRISRGDSNIRTSRYIGYFGISCREKIEVVERPPPVPLRPCGPPPPCAPQKALRWGRAKIPESATPRPPANHRATRLEPTSPDFIPGQPCSSRGERLGEVGQIFLPAHRLRNADHLTLPLLRNGPHPLPRKRGGEGVGAMQASPAGTTKSSSRSRPSAGHASLGYGRGQLCQVRRPRRGRRRGWAHSLS